MTAYMTVPHEVQAVLYDGTNYGAILDLIADKDRSPVYNVSTIGSGDHAGKAQLEIHGSYWSTIIVLEGQYLVIDGMAAVSMDAAKFESLHTPL